MAAALQERYVRWLQVRGYDPALLFGGRDWSVFATKAQRLLAAWQRMETPPTVVFCANDGIVLAILAAAKAAGVGVPQQLSIVGVDDSPAAALLADPPLTSVRLPGGEQVGREALRCLLELMRQSQGTGGVLPPPVPCRVEVPVTRLVQRASTASIL